MNPKNLPVLAWLTFVFGFIASATGQKFDEEFSLWPTDLTLGGSVILVADQFPEPLTELQSRLAPKSKTCWLVPRKSKWLEAFLPDDVDCQVMTQKWLKNESRLKDYRLVVLPFQKPTQDDMEVVEKATSLLKQFVRNGNTLVVIGGIDRFGKWRRNTDRAESGVKAEWVPGLDLVPDSAIEVTSQINEKQHTFGTEPASSNMKRIIGITVESGSAMWVRGRKVTAIGEGEVTFRLPPIHGLAAKTKTLTMAPSRRADPYRFRIDLTAWRRQATERVRNDFPLPEKQTPRVEKGTLFIVGGGGTPDGLMDEFVAQAGGKDAKLVYIPCLESEEIRQTPRIVSNWKKMGVQSATWIHTKDRNRANSDAQFLRPLKEATGIWFGGGRQWNFVDSWYGTQGHRYMKDVLARGGVIGGSSAGASVQGRYLARANPLANFDIMAAGYERGLGFLNGVAIDQHFSQRNRQPDMEELVVRYPQLLGIGIDERTAIIVQQSSARVRGKGKVYFYDHWKSSTPKQPQFIALENGQIFDLAARRVTPISN